MIEHFIQEGDWMVKLDLKDACFAVPIHHDHQKMAALSMAGPLVWPVISPPRLFTKVTCPIVA